MSTPADRFAIIPIAVRGPAPASAIVTGSLSAVMEMLPDTVARVDAVTKAARAVIDAVEAKEQKDAAVASVTRMVADTVAHLSARLNALQARRAAADAAAEARRIQDALDALPDPDDPDGRAPVHENTGDLHTLGQAPRAGRGCCGRTRAFGSLPRGRRP